MNVSVVLLLMCLFHLSSAVRKIYIPPLERTSGVIRWYIHNDTLCAFDARRYCEKQYTNGRLLQLESTELVDVLKDKYNNITDPRTKTFTVGLWSDRNATHNNRTWTNCDALDLKEISPLFSWHDIYSCYRFYFVANEPFEMGMLTYMSCSSYRPYACEDMSSGNNPYATTNSKLTRKPRLHREGC